MHLQKWCWIILATKKFQETFEAFIFIMKMPKKSYQLFSKSCKNFQATKLGGKKNIFLDILI